MFGSSANDNGPPSSPLKRASRRAMQMAREIRTASPAKAAPGALFAQLSPKKLRLRRAKRLLRTEIRSRLLESHKQRQLPLSQALRSPRPTPEPTTDTFAAQDLSSQQRLSLNDSLEPSPQPLLAPVSRRLCSFAATAQEVVRQLRFSRNAAAAAAAAASQIDEVDSGLPEVHAMEDSNLERNRWSGVDRLRVLTSELHGVLGREGGDGADAVGRLFSPTASAGDPREAEHRAMTKGKTNEHGVDDGSRVTCMGPSSYSSSSSSSSSSSLSSQVVFALDARRLAVDGSAVPVTVPLADGVGVGGGVAREPLAQLRQMEDGGFEAVPKHTKRGFSSLTESDFSVPAQVDAAIEELLVLPSSQESSLSSDEASAPSAASAASAKRRKLATGLPSLVPPQQAQAAQKSRRQRQAAQQNRLVAQAVAGSRLKAVSLEEQRRQALFEEASSFEAKQRRALASLPPPVRKINSSLASIPGKSSSSSSFSSSASASASAGQDGQDHVPEVVGVVDLTRHSSLVDESAVADMQGGAGEEGQAPQAIASSAASSSSSSPSFSSSSSSFLSSSSSSSLSSSSSSSSSSAAAAAAAVDFHPNEKAKVAEPLGNARKGKGKGKGKKKGQKRKVLKRSNSDMIRDEIQKLYQEDEIGQTRPSAAVEAFFAGF